MSESTGSEHDKRPNEAASGTMAEQITLMRGGALVSSLIGAFGGALRETRLTASLGYLIAIEPARFCEFFGIRGRPLSVELETRHGLDRSDILVRTTAGVAVIEAKVGAHDPFDQALRYSARWHVLITEYQPTAVDRTRHGCRYFRWRDLASILDELAKSSRAETRFVSRDLLKYLQTHRMTPNNQPIEVYAREINDAETLLLFTKSRMYGCLHKGGSRLAESLYFSPCFGQKLAGKGIGARVGISYVARIEQIEVVGSFDELCETTAVVRGGNWFKKNESVIAHIKTWNWAERHSFLFLAEPRLVFNPPVLKDRLQKGHGWLSKHFYTFDTLFAAWGA